MVESWHELQRVYGVDCEQGRQNLWKDLSRLFSEMCTKRFYRVGQHAYEVGTGVNEQLWRKH